MLAGEADKFGAFKKAAEGWPEEFGGGDPQLDGATLFHSDGFPVSWDKDKVEEVSVPGCSKLKFYIEL